MLSDIAVWRPGTKYSTAKKVGYLILAEKTPQMYFIKLMYYPSQLIKELLTKRKRSKVQHIIGGKQTIE